ncbi:replication initiator protein [Microviridae sp.]|nr:replication initiator protein [Microviridae sp.]
MHEQTLHEKNCFLTLTYNNAHLPDDGSLDVSHWQKFAKRMRKKMGKFRFLHCGEYGDENNRPHYHALIFGQNFEHDQALLTKRDEHELFTSPTLDKLWSDEDGPIGHASVGTLTWQSCAYVARYSMKKVTGPAADAHYGGRKPEYITMSRRPGIGSGWINKYESDVYPWDEIITNGAPSRPPKYYDNEIEKTSPDKIRRVKSARRLKAAKQEASLNEGYGRSSYDARKARAIKLERRNSLLRRDI